MLLSALLLVVAQPQVQVPPEVLREGLAIRNVGRSGRVPFPTDAVHALIASGKWKDPRAGDEITLPGGEKRAWTAFKAEANGSFNQGPIQGGYACFELQRGAPEVMILEASGHGMAYVNGEPFAGDPYGNGYLKVPIALKQGANTLLFSAGRGNLSAKLVKPAAAAMLNMADLTLPDLVTGRFYSGYCGVIVMNATTKPMSALSVETRVMGGQRVGILIPTIPPLGIYKVPMGLAAEAQPKEGVADISFALVGPSGMLDFQKATLRVRGPKQSRKVTFISGIDGSVQYYGLVPAQTPGYGKALILTPHGAGVEGIGQADAFGPKDWANIVAPTNRRPFGFDWEDWGEEDAMEVLGHAQEHLKTNPLQTYLTGHSMGGHGTWHLGVNYPDRFAVIGPSAGWVSFFSYAGSPRNKPTNPIEELFFRAMNGSDTLALKRNLLMEKVFILHGDKDDNVPVTEARTMKEQLEGIGANFDYHEEPGAGHWWDNDPAPGAACVDWPPMMKLFQDTRLPKPGDVPKVEFYTVDPGRSGACHWARIEAQNVPLALSSVNLERAPGRVKGKTVNVSRLTILPEGVDWGGRIFVAELDGQTASAPLEGIKGKGLRFELLDGKWVYSGPADPIALPVKRHLFKSAFRNGATLIYGTHGTPEQNAWALAKARFDAEQFWYRGNGSFVVMSDEELLGKLHGIRFSPDFGDANHILYGNADTNSAYRELLKGCPIWVENGRIRVGDRTEKGNAMGAIFLYPVASHLSFGPASMVGVVGGTGVQGMRLTDRLPYFTSGVQYPDWCVFGPEVYAKGTAGVIGAGFFSDEWKVLQKLSAWQAK